MGSSDEVARGYVLWLGDEAPPSEALATRGVRVDRVSARHPAHDIAALAPDLVVLGGASSGRASELAPVHAVAVIEADPPSAPIEWCWGVVSRVEAGLAPSDLAARIDALLRRLAARAHASLTLAPSELEPFVARVAEERRAGVLLCGSPPGAVAMTPDGACAPDVAELCRRTADREALSLRFFELRPGRMKILGATATPQDAKSTRLDGLAALVIDGGGAAWEQVAETLRAVGASAKLVAPRPDAIERARSADPALIVVPSTALATPAGRLLLEDPRLASAALVVIDPERLPIEPDTLRAAATEVCAPELAARARAQGGAATIERIEALGPARWIKSMARSPVRMRLRSITGHGEIVFADGKITDATFHPGEPGASALRGAAALPALVALTHGTLLVGPASAEPPHERPAPAASALRVPPPGRALPRAVAAPSQKSEPAKPHAPGAAAPSPRAVEPEPAVVPARRAAATAAAPSAIAAPAPSIEVIAAAAIERPAQAIAPAAAPVMREGSASSPRARSWPRVLQWGVVGAAVLAGVYIAVDRFILVRAQPDAPVSVAEVNAPPRTEPPENAPIAASALGVEANADEESFDEASAIRPTTTDEAVTTDEAAATDEAATAEPDSEASSSEPSTAPAGVSDRARVAALVLESDEAMRQRQYQRGLALAQEALAIDPRHARAAYDSALAMLRLRRDDEALVWAERAMGWDPADPLYPLLVGDIHQQNGRHARARAAWRRCLGIDPPLPSCERRLELAEARSAAR